MASDSLGACLIKIDIHLIKNWIYDELQKPFYFVLFIIIFPPLWQIIGEMKTIGL